MGGNSHANLSTSTSSVWAIESLHQLRGFLVDGQHVGVPVLVQAWSPAGVLGIIPRTRVELNHTRSNAVVNDQPRQACAAFVEDPYDIACTDAAR